MSLLRGFRLGSKATKKVVFNTGTLRNTPTYITNKNFAPIGTFKDTISRVIGDNIHKKRPIDLGSYTFYHAGYGIPKNRADIKKNNATEDYSAIVSKYEESGCCRSVGEDAYFHRSDAIGIGDGVGGWMNKKNGNPKLFALSLMYNACKEISRFEDVEDDKFMRNSDASPMDILNVAHAKAKKKLLDLGLKGSSTACIVILVGNELRVANLGDCGLMVVRDGDIIFRTEEQQHSFNFPYQLSTEPSLDMPIDAQVFRIGVKKGDLIIVASDGMFDNLFDEDILEVVDQCTSPVVKTKAKPTKLINTDQAIKTPIQSSKFPQLYLDPAEISRKLAERAYKVSMDSDCTESPFQNHAIYEGLYYHGGKADDISVVSAVVADLEDTPNRR
ncbi:putative protein phosphatase 2C 80 [Zancudomyces culisetae]|uniref:Protein phosphatase n=1 Tax=Zancudomyces culisetae TaxID=1213189 RepID=A0A1R1PK22_ZANCU|nr:putative protein phosphatase 2C 80 [Zancudomyces culisetae]|eukprot:OMH81316.1 putative protein phosphatase 2C 80 [Zancudomyces culisetae]